MDKPDTLRLGNFSAIVPDAAKQKATTVKDAFIPQKIAFENCTVDGKRSWCIKGEKAP